MNPALQGKTALVTGANSGLGKATALALAQMGARVLLVSRSKERGEAAQREIITASENLNVDLLLADLASQASIRKLAAEVTAKYAHLHLLVNNVGVTFMQRVETPDGIEMSLAVNHLAPFLLTNLLLDLLKASAPARIVNVGTRLDTAMDFNDLEWKTRKYNGLSAYAQSKLGNLHFTFALARRLAGSGVTVNCVHPGVFRSNLGKENVGEPLWLRLVTAVGQPFLNTPEQAAQRVLHLATAPELEGVSGKYFGKMVELPAPGQTLDAAANERLWAISAALTQLQGAPTHA